MYSNFECNCNVIIKITQYVCSYFSLSISTYIFVVFALTKECSSRNRVIYIVYIFISAVLFIGDWKYIGSVCFSHVYFAKGRIFYQPPPFFPSFPPPPVLAIASRAPPVRDFNKEEIIPRQGFPLHFSSWLN